MKTLNAKTIQTAKSQTITYKNAPLTVAWGGEFYTAIYNGDVFRQTVLSDLKKDIANGWACNDCREDDMAWVLPMQERNLKPANKQVNGSTQLRHNQRTMEACAIDKTKLDAVLPEAASDLVWHKVEMLREAFISLGATCISRNPSFILVNTDGKAVMRVTKDDRGIPSESIEAAQRFPVSQQAAILKQVDETRWTPMSERQAAEFLLTTLTNDVWWYVDNIIDTGMTNLTNIREIQSGDYFGYELPHLMGA